MSAYLCNVHSRDSFLITHTKAYEREISHGDCATPHVQLSLCEVGHAQTAGERGSLRAAAAVRESTLSVHIRLLLSHPPHPRGGAHTGAEAWRRPLVPRLLPAEARQAPRPGQSSLTGGARGRDRIVRSRTWIIIITMMELHGFDDVPEVRQWPRHSLYTHPWRCPRAVALTRAAAARWPGLAVLHFAGLVVSPAAGGCEHQWGGGGVAPSRTWQPLQRSASTSADAAFSSSARPAILTPSHPPPPPHHSPHPTFQSPSRQ